MTNINLYLKNGWNFMKTGNYTILTLDNELYSEDAIKAAAEILGIKYTLRKRKTKLEISINKKTGNIIKDFMNEILNQQCRTEATKMNEEIIKILFTNSFFPFIKLTKERRKNNI